MIPTTSPTTSSDPWPSAHDRTGAPSHTVATLRLAVGRLRSQQHSEYFPPSLHVGRLGAAATTFVTRHDDRLSGDQATRVDVLLRLIESTAEDPLAVWVTRPGHPCAEDDDHGWHAAARTATGAVGRTLTGFWVVTRFGWLDLLSGRSRTWVRLRL